MSRLQRPYWNSLSHKWSQGTRCVFAGDNNRSTWFHSLCYMYHPLSLGFLLTMQREATFPTIFSFFPVFRNIILRERISIVHAHASLSSLGHEAILHAKTMGLKTVFTDHSLFGFADAGSIFANKMLKFTLSDVDHVICVSHTWFASSVVLH
jgi:phosphatidylinositol N-acetylglucosaminyltransferase subunit A